MRRRELQQENAALRSRGLRILGLFAGTFLLLLGVCAWAYSDQLFPPSDLSRAREAVVRGQYERAALLLEPLVRARPDHLEARVLLGRAYLKLNRPQAAATQFMHATKLEPEDASLWVLLGEASKNCGWSERALSAYARATELTPQDAKAWRERGLLEMETGNHAMAVMSLMRSYELDESQRDLPELIARAVRGPERDQRDMETAGGLGLSRRATHTGVVLPAAPDPLAEINRSRRTVK